MKLQKQTFRDQIREILNDQLFSGKLKSGEKISLAELARKLETSVTPVREALTQLEHEGIIQYIPNVGFCVRELSVEEAWQTYQVIGMLESYAVSLSTYSKKEIKELKQIIARKKVAKTDRQRLQLDKLFHDKLTGNSENKVALETLEHLKKAVFVFEMAFLETVHQNVGYDSYHQDIVNLLEKNKIETAAMKTKEHWTNGSGYLNEL
jgi:DNA-binding GntR family transcriptional regulator